MSRGSWVRVSVGVTHVAARIESCRTKRTTSALQWRFCTPLPDGYENTRSLMRSAGQRVNYVNVSGVAWFELAQFPIQFRLVMHAVIVHSDDQVVAVSRHTGAVQQSVCSQADRNEYRRRD